MKLEQVGCVWGPQSLIVEVMETEESAGLWRSVGNQLRKIYCYVQWAEYSRLTMLL